MFLYANWQSERERETTKQKSQILISVRPSAAFDKIKELYCVILLVFCFCFCVLIPQSVQSLKCKNFDVDTLSTTLESGQKLKMHGWIGEKTAITF